jgi:hypothetical protein
MMFWWMPLDHSASYGSVPATNVMPIFSRFLGVRRRDADEPPISVLSQKKLKSLPFLAIGVSYSNPLARIYAPLWTPGAAAFAQIHDALAPLYVLGQVQDEGLALAKVEREGH